MELDPTLARVFAAEIEVLFRSRARWVCWIALVLTPLYSLLDRILYPEQVAWFGMLRVLMMAATLLIWWLLGRPRLRVSPVALMFLAGVVTTTAICAMTMVTGYEASPYYAGIILILLGTGAVLPWSVQAAIAFSTLVIGGYTAAMLTGPLTHPATLVSNLTFICSTGSVIILGAVLQQRLRSREFQARSGLEQALQHKSEFLASMSHELRTPLHIMIGYADMVLEELPSGDPDGPRPLVERIRTSTLNLHHMISELLDLAKIEAGRMELHASPVDIAEVMQGLSEAFGRIATRKGLSFDVAFDADAPRLLLDRMRLDQILTNLIGNAIKFTTHGGIRVEARWAPQGGAAFLDGYWFFPASVGKTAAGPAVVFVVTDSGAGIRTNDLPRLAEDFRQLDEAAAGKFGGTGLGLSISRQLATLLGGQLAVRSWYGEGSSFAVVVPATATALRAAA